MKLLVFTQKVDKNDTVLGFFHGWIVQLSKRAESVSVICLEKGEFDLPKNVTVYSLGKESEVSKFNYVVNLYRYLHVISGSYDRVFVHMNQEYALLGGVYWKLKGVPVYMWRNHQAGSLLTRVAVLFCSKLFCTSTDSFTARFKKAVIMPAGIDTEMFKPVPTVVRKKYSVCMVGRIAPVKHIDLALEAINHLALSGVQVSLTIVGSYIPRDKEYYESVKQYVIDKNLSTYVHFVPGVPPEKLPEIYSGFEICVNFTDSGSFDKTIVEAGSCGTIPLVSNISLQKFLPEQCFTKPDPASIASAIQRLLLPHEQVEAQKDIEVFVKSQSLSGLMEKLFTEIK